jgi:hypothetical protein
MKELHVQLVILDDEDFLGHHHPARSPPVGDVLLLQRFFSRDPGPATLKVA